MRREPLAGLGAQAAAEIGPSQIGVAIGRRALDAQGLKTERREVGLDRLPVDGRVHGVARARVRHRELQDLARSAARSPARPRPMRASVKRRSTVQGSSAVMLRDPEAWARSAMRGPVADELAMRIGEADALEPGLELGRTLQAQRLAHVERVVERGRLVVEHDVVGAGDAHDERHAGRTEQHEEHVHVVLVGLGVVGVADVAAHRQAHQLAAEVILEAGADDLLAVVEILGADEADDGVDEQRLELARDGVGACFERLLVDAVMGIGRERRALAGLEVHDVVADRAALEAEGRLAPLFQDRERDAEGGVDRLRAADRLEHEIDRARRGGWPRSRS